MLGFADEALSSEYRFVPRLCRCHREINYSVVSQFYRSVFRAAQEKRLLLPLAFSYQILGIPTISREQRYIIFSVPSVANFEAVGVCEKRRDHCSHIKRADFDVEIRSCDSLRRPKLCRSCPEGRHERLVYFIRSNVFWRSCKSEALPVFSRLLSIHFFSRAFFVGRSF